jgi:dihydrofolate synthase/folylpolyglutamate synthase
MNFQESIRYLYNLGYELSVKKFGLENTFKLLKALNNPEKNYLKVQIAGTNGKGSTCAFLDAICVSANIKTGLYTSPHLISVTERIKIGGREISKEDFAAHATRIRKASENLVKNEELDALPTFFEQVTAIALSYFADEKVEIAILETGIGGRFDATTAARAEIAAITRIDFDHQNILGNSLAEIASEKAAIIRADTPFVLGEQSAEAEKVILDRCANLGVTSNFAEKVIVNKRDENNLTFQTEKAVYKNVRLNLQGRHQIENAKVAILLAEILQENFKISPENIVEGLQTAIHRGRLEFYKNILFDGAHNQSGARALREYLDEFVSQPVTMIFGAMEDKNLSEIGAILFPKAEKLIFTKPDNPRSTDASELMRFLPENFDKGDVFVIESVEKALKKAFEISAENLICVTGSLYLVGEAQKILSNPSFLSTARRLP